MTRCLGIDSDDELVTRLCRAYRDQNVYPTLINLADLTRCAGADAVRANVQRALDGGGVHLITGSGHGFPARFTGQGRNDILSIGQYQPIEVTGSIVHLLSCNTAAELGADLVANGCRAFFGYDVEFIFPEEAARLFFDADSQIDFALAGGASASGAYNAAINRFDLHIRRALASGKIHIAAALKRNRDHLCAPSKDAKWGDPAAQLF